MKRIIKGGISVAIIKDGENGKDGRSVISIKEQYYLSTSSSELAGGSWADAPQPWADGKYFWTRSTVSYSDGTSASTDPVCVSGGQGASGSDGRGIASVDVEYYQSDSATELTGGSWQTEAPAWASGKYVWQRTKTTYTDGSSAYTEPACLTGEKGADGRGIATATTDYGVSADEATQPASWSTEVPTLTKGTWLWTRTTVSYTSGDPTYSYSKAYIAKDGTDGDDGLPGKDGTGITGTDKEYCASADGETAPSSGWQATIPEVPQGQYLWIRITWHYSDGTSEQSYSVSHIGKDGTDGTSVTIMSKSVLYAISSSGTAAPSTGWQAEVPEATKDKPFVWTRTTVNYSDGTTTTAYSVGRIGSDGKGISATKTMFGASSSPETQPASWSETEPELGEGEYLWTKEVTTYTDGTTSETVPVVSLDYLSRVIRKGSSALMGGLVLGNILAAADANGDVRSFLSGLLSLPALGLGVSGFGLDAYKAVTELNHDGSGHVGRFRFETRKDSDGNDEASSFVGFEDHDGKMRIVMTSDTVPTLADMTSATQSATKGYSGTLQGGDIEQGPNATATATGSLTVINNGSRLTVSYDVTSLLMIPDGTESVTSRLTLYRNGAPYALLASQWLQRDYAGHELSGTVVLQNVQAGTYDVRMSATSIKGSSMSGSIKFVGDLSVYFDGTEQKVVLGRDGLMAYHSPTSYVELRKNASGQPLNVSGVQIGQGWGFGVLWMGKVNENGGIYASFGPLRAKGRGNATKSSSDYTVEFPGGSSTVGSDYAVFCQPEMPSDDGRYVTVYRKTSSSFHVVTRWGDSQRDASFYFMVVSMKGWY